MIRRTHAGPRTTGKGPSSMAFCAFLALVKEPSFRATHAYLA